MRTTAPSSPWAIPTSPTPNSSHILRIPSCLALLMCKLRILPRCTPLILSLKDRPSMSLPLNTSVSLPFKRASYFKLFTVGFLNTALPNRMSGSFVSFQLLVSDQLLTRCTSFSEQDTQEYTHVWSIHISDTLSVYGGGNVADHLIHFANNLNSNPSSRYQWSKYTCCLQNRHLSQWSRPQSHGNRYLQR